MFWSHQSVSPFLSLASPSYTYGGRAICSGMGKSLVAVLQKRCSFPYQPFTAKSSSDKGRAYGPTLVHTGIFFFVWMMVSFAVKLFGFMRFQLLIVVVSVCAISALFRKSFLFYVFIVLIIICRGKFLVLSVWLFVCFLYLERHNLYVEKIFFYDVVGNTFCALTWISSPSFISSDYRFCFCLDVCSCCFLLFVWGIHIFHYIFNDWDYFFLFL